MIVVEWTLTTFSRQEPWLDTPPRTRGVAHLHAAGGATGDPTRAWWHVQPRLLTQKRGQFLLQPTSLYVSPIGHYHWILDRTSDSFMSCLDYLLAASVKPMSMWDESTELLCIYSTGSSRLCKWYSCGVSCLGLISCLLYVGPLYEI